MLRCVHLATQVLLKHCCSQPVVLSGRGSDGGVRQTPSMHSGAWFIKSGARCPCGSFWPVGQPQAFTRRVQWSARVCPSTKVARGQSTSSPMHPRPLTLVSPLRSAVDDARARWTAQVVKKRRAVPGSPNERRLSACQQRDVKARCATRVGGVVDRCCDDGSSVDARA